MVDLPQGYGIYSPEEVDFLRNIYDEICASRRPFDDEEQQAVAKRLLVLYRGGSRDREFLKISAGGAESTS